MPRMKQEHRYLLLPNGNYVPITPTQPKLPIPPTVEWDGWPDGFFEQDFSPEELEETSNLRVHWVCVGGGDRRGYEHAETWQLGKTSSRRCLGVIECDNPTCNIIIRPQTTTRGINKQTAETCQCGAALFHRKCDVISYLWRWSDGRIHYLNGGYHTHRRPPTRVLAGTSKGYREWRLKPNGREWGR